MNIFIACSSKEHYNSLTEDIAACLSSLGYNLYFGASSSGMMGICYREFLKQNRNITSITVDKWKDLLNDIKSTETFIFDSTYDRLKALSKADKILILPGGSGTISELFGILEEFRTKDEKNKLILYNMPYKDGYYFDFFEDLINRFIEENYNDSTIKNYYSIVKDKKELIKKLGGIK